MKMKTSEKIIKGEILRSMCINIDLLNPTSYKQDKENMVPQASIHPFGTDAKPVEPILESGTATIVAGSGDDKHVLAIQNRSFLGMRQDETRSLQQYLSRPVVIVNQSLLPMNYFTYHPLELFLTNPRIRDKIRGYAYLNATLNIKVTVTASPLVSGAMMVALNPWQNRDTGIGTFSNITGNTLYLQQLSQLPNVLLDLATEKGGEISMPLICPTNGLNITSLEQIKSSFVLHTAPVTVTRIPSGNTSIPHMIIYAWLTDVSLVGTTWASELPTPQSSEFVKDANARGASSDITFKESIMAAGKYIKGVATRVAIEESMDAMGFSSPIEQVGPISQVPRMVTNMSCYNSDQYIDSLASDMKQQIPYGTADLGFEDVDHMSLDNILDRYGYLGQTMIATNDVLHGQSVTTINVTPMGCGVTLLGTQFQFLTLPVNVAALAFNRWRGGMVYKFHAVGSALLKGKIAIRHDTIGTYDAAKYGKVDTQALNTVIWDLSTTRTIEVEVPWTSNLPFKSTGALFDPIEVWTNPTSLKAESPISNGCLLFNEITPVSDGALNGVGILIFAKGCRGMAFGDLRPVLSNYTFAGVNNGTSGVPLGTTIPQSSQVVKEQELVKHPTKLPPGLLLNENGTFSVVYLTQEVCAFLEANREVAPQSFSVAKNVDVGLFTGDKPNSSMYVNIAGLSHNNEDDDVLTDVCFGEKFFSLRQVIKRYTMNWVRMVDITTNLWETWFITLPDRPIMKGFLLPGSSMHQDPTGRHVNYVRDSFFSFYSVCFLGYRGSIRHKVVTANNNVVQDTLLHVTRTGPPYAEGRGTRNLRDKNGSASMITSAPDLRSGGTVTNTNFTPVLEYSTPYQSRAKFSWAQDRHFLLARYTDDGGFDTSWHTLQLTASGVGNRSHRVEKYVAAGDDFSLFFYKYSPVMVNSSPTPYTL